MRRPAPTPAARGRPPPQYPDLRMVEFAGAWTSPPDTNRNRTYSPNTFSSQYFSHCCPSHVSQSPNVEATSEFSTGQQRIGYSVRERLYDTIVCSHAVAWSVFTAVSECIEIGLYKPNLPLWC